MTDAERAALDKMLERDFGPAGLDMTGPEVDGFPVYVTCADCNGEGYRSDGTECPECGGKGLVEIKDPPE